MIIKKHNFYWVPTFSADGQLHLAWHCVLLFLYTNTFKIRIYLLIQIFKHSRLIIVYKIVIC